MGAPPIFDICAVVANRQLSATLWWISLAAPQIADQAMPGQFVHIAGSPFDPLLRRPYSIARIDHGEAVIEILYHVVGRGSGWLAELGPGATVDTLGPLGSGFTVVEREHLLLIGGGIGLGPLIALAHQHRAAPVVVLNGARSSDGLTPSGYLPERAEVFYATDDGSQGICGSVVDLMPDWYHWADAIYACGPNPMLRACAQSIAAFDPAPARHRKRTQFALEARMACGLGICYSCVVTTTRGLQRVCSEGPVFDARELTWQWESGI